MGKQAMKTGMNIAQEAMLGHNVKKAAKRHLSQGLTELVTQHGRGRPRRRRRGPPGQRVKRRKIVLPRQKKPKRGYKKKSPFKHQSHFSFSQEKENIKERHLWIKNHGQL